MPSEFDPDGSVADPESWESADCPHGFVARDLCLTCQRQDGPPTLFIPATIYVSIGNSDDKLTQSEWSSFVADVNLLIRTFASVIHGQWFSVPDARWQNACWCFEAENRELFAMRIRLRTMATQYRQESIAWAVAPVTELLGEEAAAALKETEEK